MSFDEALPLRNNDVMKILSDSSNFSDRQKVVIIGLASLAIGVVLYKSWRYSKRESADSEFFRSLEPSDAPRHKRILVVGLKESGKTTFVKKFCKRPHGLEPTERGQYIKQHSVIVGNLSIIMWDVCGGVQNQEIWHDVFKIVELDFIIFCVDSTATNKFVDVRKELHRLLKIKVFRPTPIILLATKQDKSGAVDPYTLFLSMNLENFQGSRPIHSTGIQVTSFGQSEGFLELYNLLSTIDA